MTEKNKWDTARFFKTLAYFEIIPFIGCLQRLFRGNKQHQTLNLNDNQNMGIILVAGATGGVGKRVVRRLLEQNYQVRALVRDAKRAKEILGEKVELFEADMTIPQTLTTQLMDRVTAIICCTGTKVQPVEGDTPNREKYYQGIKFYLPEVLDIPEKIEYQGIKNLAQLANKFLRSGEKTIFNFKNPSQDVKELWGAVDDVVMGGVSSSDIRFVRDNAVFSGFVSTDNNGGFASVRTRNLNPPLDLSEYQGINLRLKGDGKRYKFIIRCEGKWDGIGYCYSFDTVYNCWLDIFIPFADLIPVFRAKTVPEAGIFDKSQVYSMQLMLSKFEYDGGLNPKFEPGLFTLEVESIKAYGGNPKSQFVMVSSAGVTRPGKLGLNLDEEPPAVRLNDQLGGILTWKLKGEEALKQSGLTYTVIRPCALTEQPGNKVLVFAQGDTIKGQVSREAIASLCIEAINNPKAANKTFEVREEIETIDSVDWDNLFANLQSDL